MEFREAWLSMDQSERDRLVAKVGSSYGYLQKLSGGFGTPSLEMLEKIQKVLPGVTARGFIKARKQAGRRASPRI